MALRNSPAGAGAGEALADCVEESDRVLTMLKTLLDVAEAEAGVMKLNLEPVDLCKLLGEARELYEYVAEEKKLRVNLDCQKPCEAVVDRVRMRQVFANLLDNAIKYTPEGGSISIKAISNFSHDVITFQDTGMGIPPEEQSRIWDRLYRGDKSRSQRGLGLGLSLVKAIVQAHHGTAEVLSQPGLGATFNVYLPRSSAPPVVIEKADSLQTAPLS